MRMGSKVEVIVTVYRSRDGVDRYTLCNRKPIKDLDACLLGLASRCDAVQVGSFHERDALG